MVFCFSFIVNCAKLAAPIKGPKHVFNIHDIGTCRLVKMRMRSGFLLTGCCLFTRISFHKKALSKLNIYKIVIRLKSQVLRKEKACGRQTDTQSVFCSRSKPLEHWADALTTWAPRVVQNHYHIFSLCWPIRIVWTRGRLWKSYVLSQGSDVAYIGHWQRAMYPFDRQTDILTDRQTNR